MKEMTKDILCAAVMAALSTGLLLVAMLLVAGCGPAGGLAAEPAPAAGTVVHGYETADGAVVRYSGVEAGRDSGKGGSGKGDYSDRATAR